VYQIRPYTFQLLRAIKPFFELIAISCTSKLELESIIDFIESILNKPITDLIRQQQQTKLGEKKKK